MEKYFLMQLLCLLTLVSKSQSPNVSISQITPVTPEAATIAKYVNYPVNYGTGLPNITIPLYEIQVKDIKVPIYLSYHSSGLKVAERAGWVGSGWTLFAEPGITRSINGLPDEKGLLLNNLSVNDFDQYKLQMVKGYVEEEPDEFYYRLPSKSGGFYFSKIRGSISYNILTHPFEPLRINYYDNKKFEITDENGLLYRFGTSGTGIQAYERTNGEVTALKCTEIYSNTSKETVSFSYSSGGNEMVGGYIDRVLVEDSLNNTSKTTYFTLTGCNAIFPVVTDGSTRYGYSINTNTYGQMIPACTASGTSTSTAADVESLKLSQIIFANGKVIFEKNSQNNLSAIKVYNGTRLLKVVKLFQSTFYSDNPNVKRLRLDSIQIGDGNLSNKTYKFSYNESAMPNYTTKSTDMWGYFNNAGNVEYESAVPLTSISSLNQFLNPAIPITINIGKANRTPNSFAAQTGVLKTITYPTGGSTDFEYEGNKYFDRGILKTAGGLRIAKIVDRDPRTSARLERRFSYGNNENGAGFVRSFHNPEDYLLESDNVYLSDSRIFAKTRFRVYYSSSFINAFFSDGPPVVYNEVKESQIDSEGSEIGKTVHKYDYINIAAAPKRIPKTSLSFDSKNDWERGNLIAVEIYKTEGNSYKIVSKKNYLYSEALNQGYIPVGKVYQKNNVINLGLPVVTYPFENITYHSYTINTGTKRQIQERYVEYFNTDSVVKVKNQTYKNMTNLLPSIIETIGSNGESIKNYYKYTTDTVYSDPYSDFVRLRLFDDHILTALLEERYTKGNIDLKTQHEYGMSWGSAQHRVIKTNTGFNNQYQERLKVGSFDVKGNILSFTKDQGPTISYIWGYEQTYPTAEIKNAQLTDVAYTSFEEKDESSSGWTFFNGFVEQNVIFPSLTATYAKTGGRVYLLGKSTGIKKDVLNPAESYIVSCYYKNALPTLSGGTVTLIKNQIDPKMGYCEFEVTGASSLTINSTTSIIDDLRLYPKGALITTYTYDPLVGITSSTDLKGEITYYEYDNFQQLLNIKDKDGNIVKSFTYNYLGQ